MTTTLLCGNNGVMLRRSILGLAAAVIGSVRADASQFGNIFGGVSPKFIQAEPQLKDLIAKSNAASAEALEGLSDVFTALQDRELAYFEPGKLEAGKARLLKAAGALDAAKEQMDAIDIPPSLNKPLTKPLLSDLSQAGLRQPKTNDLRGLFTMFKERTGDLASLLRKASTLPDNVSALDELEPNLSLYISLGYFVTRAARAGTR